MCVGGGGGGGGGEGGGGERRGEGGLNRCRLTGDSCICRLCVYVLWRTLLNHQGVMDTGEAAIEVQRREVCELALSSEESTAVGDQFRDFFTDGTEVCSHLVCSMSAYLLPVRPSVPLSVFLSVYWCVHVWMHTPVPQILYKLMEGCIDRWMHRGAFHLTKKSGNFGRKSNGILTEHFRKRKLFEISNRLFSRTESAPDVRMDVANTREFLARCTKVTSMTQETPTTPG